jgi:type IV pilus assembly protein PilO
MTNLQQGASRVSGQTLRRLWLFTPIAIGGVATLLLVAAALVPVLAGMREASQRLQQLEGLADERALLRAQLARTEDNLRSGEQRQSRILGLISGSGDLSTFLSQLQREADRTGVQLELFEPQQAAAPSGQGESERGRAQRPQQNQQGERQQQQDRNQAQGQPRQGGNPADAPRAGAGAGAGAAVAPSGPPELRGLRRRTSLLTVRGTYPRLLAFMRNLEALNVLVVQSDLDLSLEEASSGDQPARLASGTPVTLKFSVSLYDQPEEKSSSPVATTAN